MSQVVKDEDDEFLEKDSEQNVEIEDELSENEETISKRQRFIPFDFNTKGIGPPPKLIPINEMK